MKSYDIVGIGAGPANLSLAALATKAENLSSIFIEKRKEFVWHAGMLLPDAKLQVPFLNDLVTLADPTNPYSFLNFLTKHNRLYQFIAANFNPLTRVEFNQYFQWVFNELSDISKSEEVFDVTFDGKNLLVSTSRDIYHTRNLVLGIGQSPFVPDIFQNYLGKDVYHNSHFLHQSDNYKNKRIAVIGGGQSGAEIVQSLLSDETNLPQELYWISRRSNFSPLDDTPFTNEIFTPKFINYFHSLDNAKREYLIKEQKLANQGISECTAREIYQKLYELKFIKNCDEKFYLAPSHTVISVNKINNEYQLTTKDSITENTKVITVDKIILCTGYRSQLPEFLSNIKSSLKYEGDRLVIDKDYQLSWEGKNVASIYIQNGAEHTHGVSDSTLSTTAYRSATILNKIAGYPIYPNINDSPLISWGW